MYRLRTIKTVLLVSLSVWLTACLFENNTDSNTSWYRDSDGDGYGNPDVLLQTVDQPNRYVSDNTDCNDDNFEINPGMEEWLNNVDDNCNSLIDENLVKYLFVSSALYSGNLGGLDAADTKCQELADTSALIPRGNFRAWISNSTQSADINMGGPRGIPIHRVDGVLIANGLSDLEDGSLTAPINRDENGLLVSGALVWTGTNYDGERMGGDFCSEWSSSSNTNYGLYGISDNTDSYWSAAGSGTCDNKFHLYCLSIAADWQLDRLP
jgi:hypothetical protein